MCIRLIGECSVKLTDPLGGGIFNFVLVKYM